LRYGVTPTLLLKRCRHQRSYAAQLLAKRAPVHIPDLETDEALLRSNSRPEDAFKPIGLRTYLIVPMLKDEEVIGTLAIGRLRVQPFANKVIELITDFAAEAAIALEITRRERQYRELQMELAHANRITTMGQLTASIVHEVNQPITAAVTYALAARRWLSADPPNFREVDDASLLLSRRGIARARSSRESARSSKRRRHGRIAWRSTERSAR